MALFLFTKAIMEGKPIKVFNHGKMRRDFTYIDDIVQGVVRVADRVAAPNPDWDAAAPDPGASAVAATQTAALSTPPSLPVASAPKAAAPAVTTQATTTAPASGPDAIYTNAGISVFNPDGTRKTDQQLREELQAYYISQKKAKNPNYGTFMNIGNIFKDE